MREREKKLGLLYPNFVADALYIGEMDKEGKDKKTLLALLLMNLFRIKEEFCSSDMDFGPVLGLLVEAFGLRREFVNKPKSFIYSLRLASIHSF